MYKYIKVFLLFSILMIFSYTNIREIKGYETQKQNNLSHINMDVYIDKNGNAHVKEIWEVSLYSGTEGFKSFSKLDNMTITNFKVTDDKNRIYEFIPNWNPYNTFEQKAYKNGIISGKYNVDLCWGISKYGNRTYTLEYDISNFVKQYTDYQGIYFNFIKMNQHVGRSKIIINSDVNFLPDNTDMEAQGYIGTKYFIDGKMKFETTYDGLSESNYMTVLIKFKENLFNIEERQEKSFEELYNTTKENYYNQISSKYNSDDINKKTKFSLFKDKFSDIINYIFNNKFVIYILDALFIGFVVIIDIFRRFLIKRKVKNITSNKDQIEDEDKIDYWREIPCNKNIRKIFWIAYNYDIAPQNTLKKGVISAILLKWEQNNQITIEKDNQNADLNDNNYKIILNRKSDNKFENYEKTLFEYMMDASEYGTLKPSDFKNWCTKHYEEISTWLNQLLSDETQKLKDDGLIKTVIEEHNGLFGSSESIIKTIESEEIKNDAIKIIGFKKFLTDFSEIQKREIKEINIFKEYLIFAQLLGISNVIEKNLKNIYPEFTQEFIIPTEITNNISTFICETIISDSTNQFMSGAGFDLDGFDFGGGSNSSWSSGGGSSAGGSSGGGFR